MRYSYQASSECIDVSLHILARLLALRQFIPSTEFVVTWAEIWDHISLDPWIQHCEPVILLSFQPSRSMLCHQGAQKACTLVLWWNHSSEYTITFKTKKECPQAISIHLTFERLRSFKFYPSRQCWTNRRTRRGGHCSRGARHFLEHNNTKAPKTSCCKLFHQELLSH